MYLASVSGCAQPPRQACKCMLQLIHGEREPSPRGNGRPGWAGGGRGRTHTVFTSGFGKASSHQLAGAIPAAFQCYRSFATAMPYPSPVSLPFPA
eukprot:7401557-Pyramimonas_sp.AAC.1